MQLHVQVHSIASYSHLQVKMTSAIHLYSQEILTGHRTVYIRAHAAGHAEWCIEHSLDPVSSMAI